MTTHRHTHEHTARKPQWWGLSTKLTFQGTAILRNKAEIAIFGWIDDSCGWGTLGDIDGAKNQVRGEKEKEQRTEES